MSKTAEQVQAMKAELQAWLEMNGYGGDSAWHGVEETYEGREPTLGYPHYLVLGYDGRLSELLRGAEWPPQPGLLNEFQAILRKHDCWDEDIEHGLMAIIDNRPRD